MTVASRVRQIYERRPYPPPASRSESTSWALGAIPWLEAVSEGGGPLAPRRILIAGCGVGTEAFAFARAFPTARVVGVDFSPRSIETARRLARTSEVKDRVTFEVGDLGDADLPAVTGRKFDLIVCHGVLSYIPDVAPVFRNFVRCLNPAGLLVLGVNGAAHPSGRWRGLLPSFGIDTKEFRDGTRVRQVLRIFDSLTAFPPVALADMPAGYLAGDLFGPLNRAVPLSEWLNFAERAGLHFVATYNAFFAMRNLLNRDLHGMLMPRSRAGLALVVDALLPASFHQIVLSRAARSEIDWSDGRKVLALKPQRTALYTIEWPRRRAAAHAVQSVVLTSVSAHTKIALEIPQWEVSILKNCDGERTLRELLGRVRVPARTLSEAMYLLYQLTAVNFR